MYDAETMTRLSPAEKLKFIGDTTRVDRLHGKRNETIYVSHYGYWHASEDFVMECKIRNIDVKVVVL